MAVLTSVYLLEEKTVRMEQAMKGRWKERVVVPVVVVVEAESLPVGPLLLGIGHEQEALCV